MAPFKKGGRKRSFLQLLAARCLCCYLNYGGGKKPFFLNAYAWCSSFFSEERHGFNPVKTRGKRKKKWKDKDSYPEEFPRISSLVPLCWEDTLVRSLGSVLIPRIRNLTLLQLWNRKLYSKPWTPYTSCKGKPGRAIFEVFFCRLFFHGCQSPFNRKESRSISWQWHIVPFIIWIVNSSILLTSDSGCRHWKN